MTTQGPITGTEFEEFLHRGLICRFACVDENGWPYVVPVWFDWDGSEFWIVAQEHANWVPWVEREPRVALCIDVTGPNRRVMSQGIARIVETPGEYDRARDVIQRIGERYMSDQLESYVATMAGQRHWLIAVKPERLTTWQGPSRA